MNTSKYLETKFRFGKDARHEARILREKGIEAKVYRGHRHFVLQVPTEDEEDASLPITERA